jgi:hypothetical protein
MASCWGRYIFYGRFAGKICLMIHYMVECFQISFTFYNAKKPIKKQYIFPNVYDVITTSFKKFKYCVVNKKILNAENDNLLFNPFYLGIRGYWCLVSLSTISQLCCHYQTYWERKAWRIISNWLVNSPVMGWYLDT